jgi:hypothetical protein
VKNHKFLFSFALILFSFYNVIGQTYYKYPVTNYTPKNYGKNQNAQNWAVTQTKEGLIYSGSSNGLIEFDGYKWSFLPARTGWTYSVACDSNNTLFVGGQSYFGCFLKDSLGGLYYEALSEKLLRKIILLLLIYGEHLQERIESISNRMKQFIFMIIKQ